MYMYVNSYQQTVGASTNKLFNTNATKFLVVQLIQPFFF